MQNTLPGPIALFASAWKLYKAHWKTLSLIAVLPSFCVYIGQVFAVTGPVPLKLLGIVVILAGVLISIAMQPALILTVQKVSADAFAAVSVKDQLRVGFSFFWPVLGLGLLNALFIIGGLTVFVIPGLVLGVYASLYLFSRILDGKKGLASYIDSFSLVHGRWWGVFGRTLFILIIYGLASIVMGGVLYLVTGGRSIAPHESQTLFSGFLNLVVVAVLVPIMISYLYNLYLSLKASRLPNAPEKAFKGWLIGFMVVGIFVPVAGLMFAAMLVSFNASKAASGSVGIPSAYPAGLNQPAHPNQ